MASAMSVTWVGRWGGERVRVGVEGEVWGWRVMREGCGEV